MFTQWKIPVLDQPIIAKTFWGFAVPGTTWNVSMHETRMCDQRNFSQVPSLCCVLSVLVSTGPPRLVPVIHTLASWQIKYLIMQ